jgi:hypothetical protein
VPPKSIRPKSIEVWLQPIGDGLEARVVEYAVVFDRGSVDDRDLALEDTIIGPLHIAVVDSNCQHGIPCHQVIHV